jgi:hypothetical protein
MVTCMRGSAGQNVKINVCGKYNYSLQLVDEEINCKVSNSNFVLDLLKLCNT